MNKSCRKFKKMLKIEFNEQSKKLFKSFLSFCNGKIEAKELSKALDIGPKILPFSDPKIYEKYNELNQKFKNLYKDECDYLLSLQLIIELFGNELPCAYFDSLIKIMSQFELTDREKAEVLAFFLNKNISNILTFDFENQKNEIQDFIDCFNLAKTKEDLSANSIMIQKEDAIPACKRLLQIINNSGNIIPNINAKAYLEDLSFIFFDTDINYLKLVTEESERKAKELLSNEKSSQKLGNESKKIVYQQAVSLEDQRKACKEQKIAVQELKKYIVDGTPTKYLTHEDLDEINNILSILNYTPEQITALKKCIDASNAKFEEEKENKKFEDARNKYLSAEEKEILTQALSIITDETAIKNEFFNLICTNYNALRQKLIKAYDIGEANDYTDELELLTIEIICEIEELTNAITNYNYSDYRFVPKRKKDDNNE